MRSLTLEGRVVEEGAVFFGDHVLVKSLGKGLYGEVWKTAVGERKLPGVIKVMKGGETAEEELKNLRRIAGTSPHFPTISNFAQEEGVYALAREYVKGQDLDEFVKFQTKVREESVVDHLLQGIRIMDHARRQGVILKDYRGKNVIKASEKNGLLVPIDWGFPTSAKNSIDTLPPSCYRDGVEDTSSYGEREQVYAIAATAYFEATGGKHYPGLEGMTPENRRTEAFRERVMDHRRRGIVRPIRGTNSEFDEDLAQIIEDALRGFYPTLKEFKDEIESYASERVSLAESLVHFPEIGERARGSVREKGLRDEKRSLIKRLVSVGAYVAFSTLFLVGEFKNVERVNSADHFYELYNVDEPTRDPGKLAKIARRYLDFELGRTFELTSETIESNSFAYGIIAESNQVYRTHENLNKGAEAAILQARIDLWGNDEDRVLLSQLQESLRERITKPNALIMGSIFHDVFGESRDSLNEEQRVSLLEQAVKKVNEKHLAQVAFKDGPTIEYFRAHPEGMHEDWENAMFASANKFVGNLYCDLAQAYIGQGREKEEIRTVVDPFFRVYKNFMKIDKMLEKGGIDLSFRGRYDLEAPPEYEKNKIRPFQEAKTVDLARTVRGGIRLLSILDQIGEEDEEIRTYVSDKVGELVDATKKKPVYDLWNPDFGNDSYGQAEAINAFFEWSDTLERRNESEFQDYRNLGYDLWLRSIGDLNGDENQEILGNVFFDRRENERRTVHFNALRAASAVWVEATQKVIAYQK